ncbi:MATE family efflux transporter [Halodesulfurarchaeum sp. HSR-GB]|uniref:MATE family efflux transporter n=1 Tax=Halodesulfurarchaeum sp. HSR-GB TaxID=3074077 RepID=UPI0028542804|nr:MATE family efflux transporter [Halodesulfurarchaeum sp. HSR-GB]MDR5656999.1 MATE family efflux transporter [Halodesulfurarchaeum sp. HSR-GB]
MSNREVNVTDGALLKPLVVLSLPIVLSQMLQVGYNLADTFWVGRVGQEAVSALSYSWPLVFLMISVAGGFTVAGTVLVAQYKGAGKSELVDYAAGQTIAFVVVVAAFFSIVGFALTPWLVDLVGARPGSTEYLLAVEYTRTIFLGVVFMFGFFIFQALLRGWGDTRTPLYLMAFGVALNVVLDPFLILGFEENVLLAWLGLDGLQAWLYGVTGFTGFGVQGAAIATVFSRGVGAIFGMVWLFSGRVGIHLSLSDLMLEREMVRRIIRLGAPSSVEQSTRALGVTVLTALVALAGDDAVAALGIGNRLNSLVFLPALGLARGTETVVGQNLGSEHVERAKRAVGYSSGIVAAVLALLSVLAYVFAEPITAAFIPGEPDVIAIGADYLRIIGPTFLFIGVFQVVQGAFRGSGSTRLAMFFAILSLWVFRLPPAYALLVWAGMGATGVWYAIALSNVLSMVAASLYFLRGTWTENVVESEPTPEPLED